MHPRHKWFVSSRTGQGNDPACVEVLFQDDAVCIRDTKARHKGQFSIRVQAWKTLVSEVKNGKLDLP